MHNVNMKDDDVQPETTIVSALMGAILGVFLVVFVCALIVVVPIITIFALEVLLKIDVEINFFTWLAAFWFHVVFAAGKLRK